MSSITMSVRPSSVEITFERGYTISTGTIPFKFGINMCMSEKSVVSKFKLQVANLCNLRFFGK